MNGLQSVDIRELGLSETDDAAAVLGRGMRDNPLHARAFGRNPDRREAALTSLFEALLRQCVEKGAILGARSSGQLVGVCAMVEPGRCQATATEKLALLPAVVAGAGLASTVRLLRWVSVWSAHDPAEPHWHLGPVGVERDLQGRGIGSTLLSEFCARMDAGQATAYLETDKIENVGFYERFGFRITAEDRVLGIRNWFMARVGPDERAKRQVV